MIGYIYGKVMDVGQGVLLVENNGIGYEVFCSASAFKMLAEKLPADQKTIRRNFCFHI